MLIISHTYEDSKYATALYVDEPENERLYYGFGMPQIANAVALATSNYQNTEEPILCYIELIFD